MLPEQSKDLIQQGKVRHFGMSEAGAKTIRRAHVRSLSRRCRANNLALVARTRERDHPDNSWVSGLFLSALLGKGFLMGHKLQREYKI